MAEASLALVLHPLRVRSMSGAIGQLASLFCKLGWHGKDEDRVIHSYTNGVQLLATHCSRCGHCYVEITPAMWRILGKP